jgi:hypothetical protein
MGITIHYHGRLQDPASLAQLGQEIQLACGRLGWPYHLIDERVLGVGEYVVYHEEPGEDTIFTEVETAPLEDRWRGVAVQPPGCETLWLTFSRGGQLVVYDAPWEEPETPGRYWVRELLSVKTQFSTPEIHVAVCGLLRLVERHAAQLEVLDEGGYWESGDQAELAARMEGLNAALDMLSGAAGREWLGEILDQDLQGPLELGKEVKRLLPLWRQDWGSSAGEN